MENRTDLAWHSAPDVEQLTSVTEHPGHSLLKPPLEKRAALRKKMVLPLKSSVNGTPTNSSFAVHTLDLSWQGANLPRSREDRGHAYRAPRHKRAQCKVVWACEIGPREIQVGIEFLENDGAFWGIPLEDERAGLWTFSSERW